MVQALLIDLDGTLVDSLPALYQVYIKFLAYYGKKGTKEEFTSLIGPSIDDIALILKEKHGLKPSSRDLSTMYVSTLMKQGFEGTELFPGAREVLEAAKKQGVKLCIVTSGTKALVKICLEPHGILPLFSEIITSDDSPRAKPHPELYRLALEKLQVPPEDAVAIEDSPPGQAAALAAGLNVIMLHPHGASLQKSKEKAVEVNNWSEIGSWLKLK